MAVFALAFVPLTSFSVSPITINCDAANSAGAAVYNLDLGAGFPVRR
jgi:hypothetical protein